jgi:hypothetical protein
MLLTLESEVIKKKFEKFVTECNAWYLVLLAVLMALAFSVYAGLQIWCVVYKNKTFTGKWHWNRHGVSVKAQCR